MKGKIKIEVKGYLAETENSKQQTENNKGWAVPTLHQFNPPFFGLAHPGAQVSSKAGPYPPDGQEEYTLIQRTNLRLLRLQK